MKKTSMMKMTKMPKLTGLTMLEKGSLPPRENKTLLEAYQDLERQRKQKETWFDEKLRALRKDKRDVFYENPEAYGLAHLTKNQMKSEIIGAKEYQKDTAPNKQMVYAHYAKKYHIPYTVEGKKKTMEQLVRDIHKYEMTHQAEIISRKVLDPVTKTYGLYIL